MTVQRTHTLQVQSQGSTIDLDELRWLVAQLDGADGKATKITVYRDEGSQMERGSVSLTANVPDAPAKPKVNYR
jgi:hypothetical protein